MKTIWTLLLEKEFIVTNMEHRDQKGLPIAADEVDHKLSREVRMLSVPGVEIPGVKYSFQLKLVVFYSWLHFSIFFHSCISEAITALLLDVFKTSNIGIVLQYCVLAYRRAVDLFSTPVECFLNSI